MKVKAANVLQGEVCASHLSSIQVLCHLDTMATMPGPRYANVEERVARYRGLHTPHDVEMNLELQCLILK